MSIKSVVPSGRQNKSKAATRLQQAQASGQKGAPVVRAQCKGRVLRAVELLHALLEISPQFAKRDVRWIGDDLRKAPLRRSTPVEEIDAADGRCRCILRTPTG